MTSSHRRCSVAGCDRPVFARALCGSHYKRHWRYGDVEGGGRYIGRSVAFQVQRKIAVTGSGCWEWQGTKDRQGYGKLRVMGARSTMAHRAAYEAFVAPIPDGMEIDHLCRNTSCVNPAHLEPVTSQENSRRYARTITACRRASHPYTAENTLIDGAGRRRCRTCMREDGRAA